MCLGIPGQLIELTDEPDLARVEVNGARRMVNLGLLDVPVAVGDWVLVHVGFAMSRMDEDEAQSELSFLRELGGLDDDAPQGLDDGP